MNKRPDSTCLRCSKAFWPKSTTRTTYCSRECCFSHKTDRSNAKKQEKIAALPKCKECGDSMTSGWTSLLCSDKCRRAAKIKRCTRACAQCALPFTRASGVTIGKYCSTECRQSLYNRNKRIRENAKRRASVDAMKAWRATRRVQRLNRKRLLKPFDPVDSLSIFNRDRFRCQLCGGPCDPNVKAPHLMSLTIDHEIPLAKGGEHVPSNLQTAHFICNSYKVDN